MKVIVINLGSTSFKFKLFEMDTQTVLASGDVERIGGRGAWRMKLPKADSGSEVIPTHEDAFRMMMGKLVDTGIISSLADIDAVGYKAVHGGELSGAAIIDDAVMAQMEKMIPFAPAHNPMYLKVMRSMAQEYPNLVQVACFETSFHRTIPEYRAVYGVPYEWVKEYGIRRYGFHGSSHSYIAMMMKKLEPSASRVISLHLGGSSSICAILDGKSVATSMGASLQSGLFHNNRAGDFDSFAVPVLAKELGGIDEAMKALSSRSGFLGLSGVSGDMRDVIEAAQNGNVRAKLTFDAFCDNITGFIGMHSAYMAGVDCLCFTGGIGQHCKPLREAVCAHLGYEIDATVDEGRLSPENSKPAIYAIETNEELMVARSTVECLRENQDCPS
ncbi:MAG: acetate/propionate family kinase [Clostridia bacterium]|nr:acetate/propionate family kinase [Clostridia bacterium]